MIASEWMRIRAVQLVGLVGFLFQNIDEKTPLVKFIKGVFFHNELLGL